MSKSVGLFHILVSTMAKVVGQGNSPLRVGALNKQNWEIWFDHAFLKHAAIPASTPGFCDTSSQSIDAPTPFDLPTGIAGAGNADACFADGVDVSIAGAFLCQFSNGKVFAKATRADLRAIEFSLPDGIVCGRI